MTKLIIQTNGHYFRVGYESCGFFTTVADPFPTLAEAQQFREHYERRFFGEWKPVDGADERDPFRH